MTTFDFTPRYATFVKRCIEVYGEDFKKDFEEKSKMTPQQFQKKIDDANTDCYYIYKERGMMRSDKGVKIIFQIEFDYFQIENESDEEEEHTPNMATLKPHIEVNYMDGNTDINLFVHTGFTEYDWVDSLIKSYTMCGCNSRLVEVKGYCKECYIMATEQEDVCCCCYENEGVWIELECKHLIHYDCWRKIEYVANTDERKKYNKKCPMCRSELSCSKYTRI